MLAFEFSRDMETEIQTIPPLLRVDINPGYMNETMSLLWIPTFFPFLIVEPGRPQALPPFHQGHLR